MERQRIAGWIYAVLVIVAAFVLGYFAGIGQTPAQVQVTVSGPAETRVWEKNSVELEQGLQTACINLNTADQQTLETLPGIGPELAAKILAYRQTVGGFVAKEQIMDVEGIGEKRYAELEQLITVEVTHENSGGR